MYRGVFSSNNRNSCSKIVDGYVSTVQSLRCFYDEADERLMYHLNQAIRCDHIEVVHVLTGDTEIFVNLMYNFGEWSEHGLEEIWTHHLNKLSSIHESVKNLPGYVVELLPTIHALSGCDTTSKVGTNVKLDERQAAHKAVYTSMNDFGIKELDENMYIMAERFLLECVTREENRSVDTFDELRNTIFHKHNLQFDLEKFPCTSTSLRLHIKRTYYQRRLWFVASREKKCDLDPIL